MAIVITDEMRAAVLAELADQCPHIFDMFDLLAPGDLDPNGSPHTAVRARDPDQLPHLRCSRCGRVWLVIDDYGNDYTDAVSKVTDRIKGPDPLKPKRNPKGGVEISDPGHGHGHPGQEPVPGVTEA